MAIGQGALTVTPLQLARAIGGLAMGGVWHQPHLVKKPRSRTSRSSGRSNPENVKDVIDGMYGVVNEGGGTGGARATAEHRGVRQDRHGAAGVQRVREGLGAATSKDLKDNAWFVGFAPRAAPEIVVVALFEHGGTGSSPRPSCAT